MCECAESDYPVYPQSNQHPNTLYYSVQWADINESSASFFAYYYNPKYWDKQAWANSVDPDQTPQKAAFNQGLHCLPLIQQF